MSPGPAVLMTMRVSMTRGVHAGVMFSFGLAIGALVWACAALFGLAALFEVAPRLLIAMKLIGALYLVWIAIKMWRGAATPLVIEGAEPLRRSPLRLTLLGITTQLANPKPAIFFGAVFITLVPPHADPATFAAVLAVVFFNEAAWNILLARLFSLSRARACYTRLKAPIDRVLGAGLAALGLKIATT
ncbi:LysE family translocator [Pseudooceanicola sp. HF7]|nr:LysE family translocator [Pseudooceanicola sp. HF7]